MHTRQKPSAARATWLVVFTTAMSFFGTTSAPAAASEPLTASIGTILSLDSLAAPLSFVRLNGDSTVYLGPIDYLNETDVTDTHFKKVQGRSDSRCVSFESMKYPGRFLRHEHYEIKLHAPQWSWSYDADATFCEKARDGYIGTVVRYESVNFPGYYITHSGSGLILADEETTYGTGTHFREMKAAELMWEGWSYHSETRQDDGYLRTYYLLGECTGVTSWWQQPVTQSIRWRVYDRRDYNVTRTVVSSAQSTSYVGFRPWIKWVFVHIDDGFKRLVKFGSGKSPCY